MDSQVGHLIFLNKCFDLQLARDITVRTKYTSYETLACCNAKLQSSSILVFWSFYWHFSWFLSVLFILIWLFWSAQNNSISLNWQYLTLFFFKRLPSHGDGSFYWLFFNTHNHFIKSKNKIHKNALSGILTPDPWSGKQWWRPLYHATPRVCMLFSLLVWCIHFFKGWPIWAYFYSSKCFS